MKTNTSTYHWSVECQRERNRENYTLSPGHLRSSLSSNWTLSPYTHTPKSPSSHNTPSLIWNQYSRANRHATLPDITVQPCHDDIKSLSGGLARGGRETHSHTLYSSAVSGLGNTLECFDKPDWSRVCPFDQLHLAFYWLSHFCSPLKVLYMRCVCVCAEYFL